MSGRLVRPLAIAIVALVVAMMAFSLASLLLPGTELIGDRPSIVDFLMVTAIVGVFPVVGLAIATRRPRNPIGWLFLLTGVGMAAGTFTTEYTDRVVSAGALLPAAQLTAWASAWMWTLGPMILLPLAILLFPDGDVPSPRWRPVIAVTFAIPILTIGAVALAPGPIVGWEGRYANPFGLPGVAGDVASWLGTSSLLGFAAFVVPGGLAVVATIVRMSRARGAERQQLKWLLYPVGLFVGAIGSGIITEHPLAWTLSLVGLAAVPIGAGIAILRYRLYDIDVVIRRTLVYGVLVGVLGIVYVSMVLVLQAALSPVTGGETLPVALSTLAIAALFGPVRSRVRTLVERRFYRSRYDAQRTLEAFAGRLRDEVELDAVGGALVTVAGRAVQPVSASLWVRRRP